MKKVINLIGNKIGVSRIYNDDGSSTTVSIVRVMKASIVDKKTVDKCGYEAVIVSCGNKKRSKLNKAEIGNIKKYKIKTFSNIYEIRKPKFLQGDFVLPEIGSELTASDLSYDSLIDVSSYSKGKGFAGTIKRWNFSGQDRSHGNSLAHRAPGSIGMLGAGRVIPGKKMAGHMGNKRVTLKNKQIIKIDIEQSVIYIKGSLPGTTGSKIWLKQLV